jgi:hypothetical protein
MLTYQTMLAYEVGCWLIRLDVGLSQVCWLMRLDVGLSGCMMYVSNSSLHFK